MKKHEFENKGLDKTKVVALSGALSLAVIVLVVAAVMNMAGKKAETVTAESAVGSSIQEIVVLPEETTSADPDETVNVDPADPTDPAAPSATVPRTRRDTDTTPPGGGSSSSGSTTGSGATATPTPTPAATPTATPTPSVTPTATPTPVPGGAAPATPDVTPETNPDPAPSYSTGDEVIVFPLIPASEM